MGLLKKLKSIFYDEEIVEVPVHKESPKPRMEEVVLPKREVNEVKKEDSKRENTFSERELFKSETTFNFPIFDDEEEVKPKTRSSVLDLDGKDYKSAGSSYRETPKAEPKVFKPSPIISPIYGILDKNYKKEQIIQKREPTYKPSTNKDINYDYVRRKAYGTLEDELENTLTKIETQDNNVEEVVDQVEEISKSVDDIEDLITKIEKNANVSIGELEEARKIEEDIEEEQEEKLKVKKEKPDVDYDSTLEHDLFNLIDSMYEDKED